MTGIELTENTETAGVGGRNYPAHWGPPCGPMLSGERTGWVRANVYADLEQRSRGIDPTTGRQLSPLDPRIASACASLARMDAAAAPAPTRSPAAALARVVALLRT